MRMGMKANKQRHNFKCQTSSSSRILEENCRIKYFYFIQKDPTASVGKQQAAFSLLTQAGSSLPAHSMARTRWQPASFSRIAFIFAHVLI